MGVPAYHTSMRLLSKSSKHAPYAAHFRHVVKAKNSHLQCHRKMEPHRSVGSSFSLASKAKLEVHQPSVRDLLSLLTALALWPFASGARALLAF